MSLVITHVARIHTSSSIERTADMKLLSVPLLLLVVLLLISCGTNGSTSGESSTSSATPPTVLHVMRAANNGFPSLDRTIQDSAAVQRLFTAAFALPTPTGSGVVNCPGDIGMTYVLHFLHGTTPVQDMSLDATGCQRLQINATSRLTNQAFLSLFLKTVEIPSLVPGQSHP